MPEVNPLAKQTPQIETSHQRLIEAGFPCHQVGALRVDMTGWTMAVTNDLEIRSLS